MGLALSTAWNSFRYNKAEGFLAEIKKLGFDSLELGFSLTPAMVLEVASCAAKGELKVVSLHNYCPIPEGLSREEALPDYYSMSSLDEEERRQAVKYTKITIDTASRLKAKAVVLHCGRVEIIDRTRELIALFDRGLQDNKEYTRLKDDILSEREKFYKPYLENTFNSLEELSDYAQGKDISLGVENRFYLREIPSFEEIGIILDKFKGSNVFYWHDTGHAQVFENLGFHKHRDYLERFAAGLLGLHLHDCTGARDHKVPSQGEVDFAMLAPYVSKETIKVIEAHYPSSAGQLRQGRKFLESIFNGKL
jgi:sugar phosphate isomerase/epimerase